MTWTSPPSFSTGQIVTAADLNTYLADNLDFLVQFVKENVTGLNSAASNSISSTGSFAQVGTIALSLTTIATVSGGADADTAVLLWAQWDTTLSAASVDVRFYNNTNAQVPSVFSYEAECASNGRYYLLGVDRPTTTTITYHLQAKKTGTTATVDDVKFFAMELR